MDSRQEAISFPVWVSTNSRGNHRSHELLITRVSSAFVAGSVRTVLITDLQLAAAAETPSDPAEQGGNSVLQANFTHAFMSCMNFKIRLTQVSNRCGTGAT